MPFFESLMHALIHAVTDTLPLLPFLYLTYLLMELLAAYARPLVQTTNAPRQVEVVTFRREEDILISAVDLFCTDELLPVRPFTVNYTLPAAPKKVIRLESREHGEEEIPFTYVDGKLTFDTAELVMFDMYRIVL